MTIRDDARIVREALNLIPAVCPTHGDDVYGDHKSRFFGACCVDGIAAYRRLRGLEAVQRLALNA